VRSLCVTSIRQNFSTLRRLSVAGTLAAALLATAACGTGGSPSGGSASPEAGPSLAEIRKDGVITVGTEGTYRPFTFHEGGGGDLTGYDVEVMEAVGDRLGVDVKFEETQWDAIFAGLDGGRFDAIANQVSINDERKAKYAFSTPYTVSPGVVVVTDDDDSVSSIADLEGKTTAQSLTSNWYELAKQNGAKVQPVEGWAQAVTLLKQGRVDATVNDRLTFLDYQTTEGDTSLKVAAQTDDQARNAIAFRKGSDSLVEAVDKALAELRADGTLARISKKYFGEDVSS
jgi:L-cystine transport system substrate-binding protein